MGESGVSRAEQERWMLQWKRAARALADQKKRELSEMTAEQALLASEALLALAPLSTFPPSRVTTSGLVQQQTLFHRRRTQ
jgi:hypothetical protein